MIFATGSNFFGQLGIANRRRDNVYQPSPFGSTDQSVLDSDSVDDVQCGNQFTAVLLKDGSVQFCGNMCGSVSPVLRPVQIQLPLKCRQVACGRKHIVALFERGVVMSWGVGYFGQLGHGDDSSWDSPRMVSALDPRRLGSAVASVACGGSHSGVLTESNKLFMWGLNRGGQCGTSSKADSILEPKPVDSTELTHSMKIATLVCGRNHSAALTSAGRVFVWGEATFGRLGFSDSRKRQATPAELMAFRSTPVAALASGDFHMLALAHSGSVYSWGYGCDGQTGQRSLLNVKVPKRVEQLDGLAVAAVECGASWSVALTSDGRMFAWGYGDGGWLGIRPPPRMPSLDCDHVSPEQLALALRSDHATSFDSRHNVLAPQPVRFLAEDWRVDRVRAGGAHMIMICSARQQQHGVVASTADDGDEEEADDSDCKVPSAEGACVAGGAKDSRLDAKSDSSESSRSLSLSSRSELQRSYYGSFSSRKGVADVLAASSTSSSAGAVAGEDSQQLISWSRHRKLAELQEALRRGADVNVADSAGNTPLIVACQTGHLAVCELLVRHGADMDRANHKGNTALHYAFNYGYEEVGGWLVGRGADEFAVNHAGLTCYEGLTREDLELL